MSGEGSTPAVVRRAIIADAEALAALAAATFPLACPPRTTDAAQADFIAKHLTETSFASYLADSQRELFVAEVDGKAAGYTMLVFDEPHDADVVAAISVRPTAELSKVYVRAEYHGMGVSTALVEINIHAARARGVAGLWLGVNEENARANRFYEKSGFLVVGTKRFLVGDCWEDDFVRERVL